MVFNCILLAAIAYTTQNLENMVVKISDKRAKTPLVSSQPYNVYKYAINTPYNSTL
jgi:hypothetical protein